MRSIHYAAIEVIEQMQLQRFKALLETVYEHSRYYAETLRAAGLCPADVTSWKDLHKLPELDTPTLLARSADFPGVPRSRLRRVMVSGGTTGSPKVCFLSDNTREILEDWAAVWSATGLSPGDLVAVMCPLPLASGIVITELAEELGCATLPLGLTTPPAVSAQLMKQLGATAVASQPSTVLRFADEVRRLGHDPASFGVAKMLLGSEVLTSKTRRQIEEEWRCEVFDRSGSTEVGMIGSECAQHDGQHLAVGSAYFEVLDLETGAPVRDGLGRLYTTSLLNLGLPLIRYDMKDIVRITSRPCTCGRTTPRITFMGRSDDRFIFETGVKLYAYQIDAALERFDRVTLDYNAIAIRAQRQDALRLVVEVPAAVREDGDLARAIAQAIVDSSADFKELHDARLIGRPEVELVPVGTLDRTARGKIQRRFRDRRDTPA